MKCRLMAARWSCFEGSKAEEDGKIAGVGLAGRAIGFLG